MLKLISINIEAKKHYFTVVRFLEKEQADVVCLQEAPKEFEVELQKLGYHTSFASMYIANTPEQYEAGVIIGSKIPHQHRAVYYHDRTQKTQIYDTSDRTNTMRVPYLVAEIPAPDTTYRIMTTHLLVTKDGKTDEAQTEAFINMKHLLQKEGSYVICGDFNMPRFINELYPKMLEHHTDCIPSHFKSSLDAGLHRLGQLPEKKHIFNEYMVDYIFTTEGYAAEDVRLEFGVSDHAAVVGYIKKTTPPSHS